MNGLRQTSTSWRTRFLLAGITGVLATGAILLAPAPAQAFWVGGGPWGGWYGLGWGYYPAPYYYAPHYYAPPPAAYYPPPPLAGYPAPAVPAPTTYYAPPTSYTPPAAGTTAPAAAGVTYTSKPAFTNAQGQPCREYMTHNSGQAVYGTACRAADGQWRVVN
jgi:hypothetical protein